MQIFEKLIRNSFISKENLFPIYSFFSGIFSDVMSLKENDLRLKKLIKIIDLWQIFYTFITNDKDIVQKEKKFTQCVLNMCKLLCLLPTILKIISQKVTLN